MPGGIVIKGLEKRRKNIIQIKIYFWANRKESHTKELIATSVSWDEHVAYILSTWLVKAIPYLWILLQSQLTIYINYRMKCKFFNKSSTLTSATLHREASTQYKFIINSNKQLKTVLHLWKDPVEIIKSRINIEKNLNVILIVAEHKIIC